MTADQPSPDRRPISKRLRYEVMRRDNFACRYCGAKAPDADLTIDHVHPVALGGSDEPENLVTACEACNAGKSSSAPDAPIVAGVSDDALRWAERLPRGRATMTDTCPTCGSPVEVVSSDEGTSHYQPTSRVDPEDVELLRKVLDSDTLGRAVHAGGATLTRDEADALRRVLAAVTGGDDG